MLEEVRRRYHILPRKNQSLLDWKEHGGKTFGYVCMNIPEEVIYAAGALPLRLLGSSGDLARVYSHFPTFTCYFSRSCLELGLQGEYELLDGILATYTCDTMHGLADVLEQNVHSPYYFFVNRPHDSQSRGALTFYLKELTRWKESLEDFLGVKISDAALSRAIGVYNLNRGLLRRIYELRRETPPLLSGTEVAELALANLVLPKEESNRLLSSVLGRARGNARFSSDDIPRVHLSGSVLSDLTLFQLVEECGGMVVSDDLCTGSRYFWDGVDINLSPLPALAQRYLERTPCPCMNTAGWLEEREEYIWQMIQRYRAQGVIFCLSRYCDPHQFDHPFLAQRFKERGIPVLTTEVEQGLAPGLKAELQTFFDIIRGHK